jgi:hypothetical protein
MILDIQDEVVLKVETPQVANNFGKASLPPFAPKDSVFAMVNKFDSIS